MVPRQELEHGRAPILAAWLQLLPFPPVASQSVVAVDLVKLAQLACNKISSLMCRVYSMDKDRPLRHGCENDDIHQELQRSLELFEIASQKIQLRFDKRPSDDVSFSTTCRAVFWKCALYFREDFPTLCDGVLDKSDSIIFYHGSIRVILNSCIESLNNLDSEIDVCGDGLDTSFRVER